MSVLLGARRRLGRTDLDVSPLILGGSVFGWTIDEQKSFAVMDAYAEAGGNMIDTADIYADGESERIIGRWLKSRGMHGKMLIATKVGATRKGGADLSSQHIWESADRSQDRLGVDRIDLYQAHVDDHATDFVETIAAFGDLMKGPDQQVRWAGCSNYSVDRLDYVLNWIKDWGLTRYDTAQLRCNLVEWLDGYDFCDYYDVSVLAYAPLAAGFLTGKYGGDIINPSGPRAEEVRRYMTPRGWSCLGALRSMSARDGVSIAQIALRAAVKHPLVAAAIVSATSPEQLRELLGALDD